MACRVQSETDLIAAQLGKIKRARAPSLRGRAEGVNFHHTSRAKTRREGALATYPLDEDVRPESNACSGVKGVDPECKVNVHQENLPRQQNLWACFGSGSWPRL